MSKEEFHKLIQEFGHYESIKTFKFLLTVEDFDVFHCYMNDRNKELNDEVKW
jgi:hypothetical protein